ncbi:hypothetical protein [Winogradskyella ursingii]|uniref:hypothetical protein n=1 Tax=Winogradskyella ursingii TaxID=2686079 RepID=UPI0015CE2849|nr:hypothetical protein [Winogradskyella ursingii]
MRKFAYLFLLFFSLSILTTSCREEKSTEDKIEDAVDDVGDAVEDTADDISDAVDDN